MKNILMATAGFAALSLLAPVSVEAQDKPDQEKVELRWGCKDIDRLDMTLDSTIFKDGKREEVTAEGYLKFKKAAEDEELSGTLVLTKLAVTRDTGNTATVGVTSPVPFTLTRRGELAVDGDSMEELVGKLGDSFEDIELAAHFNSIFPLLPEAGVSKRETWKAEHDDILFELEMTGTKNKDLIMIRGFPAEAPDGDDRLHALIKMSFDKASGHVTLYQQDTLKIDTGILGGSSKIKRKVTLKKPESPAKD